MTTKKRGSKQSDEADNQHQKNINGLLIKLRKQLRDSKVKHPLDTAVHLNEEWSALCGYEHSSGGRLVLTILSGDITCPDCLEYLRKREQQNQIIKKPETEPKRANPIVERMKQVTL